MTISAMLEINILVYVAFHFLRATYIPFQVSILRKYNPVPLFIQILSESFRFLLEILHVLTEIWDFFFYFKFNTDFYKMLFW